MPGSILLYKTFNDLIKVWILKQVQDGLMFYYKKQPLWLLLFSSFLPSRQNLHNMVVLCLFVEPLGGFVKQIGFVLCVVGTVIVATQVYGQQAPQAPSAPTGLRITSTSPAPTLVSVAAVTPALAVSLPGEGDRLYQSLKSKVQVTVGNLPAGNAVYWREGDVSNVLWDLGIGSRADWHEMNPTGGDPMMYAADVPADWWKASDHAIVVFHRPKASTRKDAHDVVFSPVRHFTVTVTK
jgi:hypothetical protein